MRHLLAGAAIAAALAPMAAGAEGHRPPGTDTEIIINATSAGPPAITSNATIIAVNGNRMRIVRQGRNGWTCMPDDPGSPGNDPMCLDANAMDWRQAWIDRKEPPKNHLGIVYRLLGGSDASKDDPFATKPSDGKKWVITGPHIMVVGITGSLGEVTPSANASMKPFVMWGGSPYEHIVIPVR